MLGKYSKYLIGGAAALLLVKFGGAIPGVADVKAWLTK